MLALLAESPSLPPRDKVAGLGRWLARRANELAHFHVSSQSLNACILEHYIGHIFAGSELGTGQKLCAYFFDVGAQNKTEKVVLYLLW